MDTSAPDVDVCVGEKQRTVTLMASVLEGDREQANKVADIMRRFDSWREIKNDENCFYRALMCQVLECFYCDDAVQPMSRRHRVFGLINHLPDLDAACVELLDLLDHKLSSEANPWPKLHRWINQPNSHVDDCLVRYCRCIMAQYLRSTVKSQQEIAHGSTDTDICIADTIESKFDMNCEEFIQKIVLPNCQEAEDIIVSWLPHAFGLKLYMWLLSPGLNIVCMHDGTDIGTQPRPSLDSRKGKKGNKVNPKKINTKPVGMQSPVSPSMWLGGNEELEHLSSSHGMHLLLRPGRFDLLYKGDRIFTWKAFDDSLYRSPLISVSQSVGCTTPLPSKLERSSTVTITEATPNQPSLLETIYEKISVISKLFSPSVKHALKDVNKMGSDALEVIYDIHNTKKAVLSRTESYQFVLRSDTLLFAFYKDICTMHWLLRQFERLSYDQFSPLVSSKKFGFPNLTTAWNKIYTDAIDLMKYPLISEIYVLRSYFDNSILLQREFIFLLFDWIDHIKKGVRLLGVFRVIENGVDDPLEEYCAATVGETIDFSMCPQSTVPISTSDNIDILGIGSPSGISAESRRDSCKRPSDDISASITPEIEVRSKKNRAFRKMDF